MKAVLKTRWEPGAIEIKDVDKPVIGPEDVLIKVIATAICGSDVEVYKASFPVQISLPKIMGHEFSGIIAEVGQRVPDLKIGDRVVAETGVVCRRCLFCKMGKQNLCPYRRGTGASVRAQDGAFAEYIKMPGINVHKVPDNVPLEEAALTEPLAVATHAVIERGRIRTGDTVAIVGPGSIGLLILLYVKTAGASKIIMTGLSVDHVRLKLAKTLGVDEVINIEEEDPVERTKTLTSGFGADLIFEASGGSSAVEQAIDLARSGGKVILVGLHSKPIKTLDVTNLVTREKTLMGSWAHTSSSWNRSLTLMANEKINVRPLITHVLSLDQVEKGFNLVEDRKAVKVLLKPP